MHFCSLLVCFSREIFIGAKNVSENTCTGEGWDGVLRDVERNLNKAFFAIRMSCGFTAHA